MVNRGQRPGPSLKARAVAYLSRREHSRQELRRKLAAWSDDPAAIEAVLNELQHQNWQSDQRYAQAYAHRTAPRHGATRILQALRQQGLQDHELNQLNQELRATEGQRAQDVWQRKFGSPPADQREYARQYRFLAGRGFSSDCIRQVIDTAMRTPPADPPLE